MNKTKKHKEELAEDYCFICKDGGHLRACDVKNCLKAYHPQCVGKDPSFLETNERWTCAWHLCFICKRSSTFQCFCCPNSVCRSCIREAEFVQVKKRLKGFCYNCLKLAMLLEDFDGGKVDFKDSVTYEFLFKDYWEIVKDQEGLTLVDLHAANALLKQGENCKSGSDSDRFSEKELISKYDDLEDDCDNGKSFLKDLKVKRGRMKTPMKRFRSKRRTYVGWGSEELIGFLTSIGKDAKEPLTQLDASAIVKDYVQANNLFHPAKKKNKVVACDEKLYSLFRKKNLKVHKIYSLLESHLAANADMDDEFSLCSEDDDNSVIRGKQRRTNSDSKIHKAELNHCKQKVVELPKSCYASVVDKNIKSVYLRRSLIMNLLKNPENFENKVIGCFVRVKNDPKDFYHRPQNLYQLGKVTGIKKAPQAYKVGETLTDTVLCVSNMCRDIQISLLSDDDFKEEECEVLRELVQKGLLKRPMVADLEKMIRNVHEDITNHWIDREIVKLQKLIDQANEKGWRRELFEYIERRELLHTPAERSRLLKEIPQVIADTEETGATTDTLLNPHGENKEGEPFKSSEINENINTSQIIKIIEDEETPRYKGTADVQIIDLDEDEEDCLVALKEFNPSTADTCYETAEAVMPEWQKVCHCIDPSGIEQGPFAMLH